MNIDTIIATINDVLNGNDEHEVTDLIEMLKVLDDYYYNDNPIIDDSLYDSFYNYVKSCNPSNVYFIGVGSQVRGGKVPLPHAMPSLNQIQIGEITQWVRDNNLYDEELIITDKLDGASAMIIYDSQGKLQISFSRGDGIQGADTTRHTSRMKHLPQAISKTMEVRCEVEISEPNFSIIKNMVSSSSGEPYRNARNMVSGLMNASTNPSIVYDYINVIAYSILGPSDKSKEEQLLELKNEGFEIPHFTKIQGKYLTDEYLANYINERRANNPFAIDGIVIDVNRSELRKQLDVNVDEGNPKSSIKYKVADASNQYAATVNYVEWNISKHGYLKPRVVFHPFPLAGVTVTHTTGYNAKYILDNNIGPGTVCIVSRCGDVVPNIMSMVKATKAQMPTENWKWNETGVDAVLTEVNQSEEVKILQLLDFCSSLDFPHLKEGNVRKLYEDGIKTPYDIVNITMVQATRSLGSNGIKAYHGIRERLSDVALSDVMGAYPSFGRGIGQRKMKKLVEALGDDPHASIWNGVAISMVEGFDTKTASLVMNGLESFLDFYDKTQNVITYKGKGVKVEGKLTGHKIVMTGFRDKELEKRVEELGGENQSAVSAKTTIVVAADPDSTSGKASKARELTASGKANIKVMSVKQFKEFVS